MDAGGEATVMRCGICQFEGEFQPYGESRRPNAKCPECGSLERTRAFYEWIGRLGPAPAYPHNYFLHIACLESKADQHIEAHVRELGYYQVTTDLYRRSGVQADLTDMAILADGAVAVILCIHVLEHIPDDRAAIAELARILQPGGLLVFEVPIESPRETFRRETPSRNGHVWACGADYIERLLGSGELVLEETREYAAEGTRGGVVHLLRRRAEPECELDPVALAPAEPVASDPAESAASDPAEQG